MAAAVEQGGGAALLIAKQDNRFPENPARHKSIADFVAPGGDIPRVANEHAGRLPRRQFYIQRRARGNGAAFNGCTRH